MIIIIMDFSGSPFQMNRRSLQKTLRLKKKGEGKGEEEGGDMLSIYTFMQLQYQSYCYTNTLKTFNDKSTHYTNNK